MKNRHTSALLGGAIATAQVLFLAGCGSSITGSSGSTSNGVEITDVGTINDSTKLQTLVPGSVKKTKLRVLISAPYPPFEMFDSNNQLEGADVDFAKAIGAKLGLPTSLNNVDFAGVIPAMQAHRYDIALAGMADTDERQKVLGFIDYVQTGGSVLVVPKNHPRVTSFTDVCGRSVGVEKGTTYGRTVNYNQKLCTKAGKPPVKLVTEPTQASALLAIQSGSIEALLTGAIPAAVLEKDQPDKVTWVRDPSSPKGYFDNADGAMTYSGLGVTKDNKALFEAVYQAARELGADGTTKKIFTKWGIGNTVVVPPLKNQGDQ
ncbi:ABC transporter substrate-binding protein [Streptomyces mirabilis]|uniref:ABC transporter substrate-binding protein n=1 Tax=Streptomyces mirabilis TaxID=68239 RepID=UPI003329B919